MAIYFLRVKSFGRGAGSSAPAAAAYRAGERIRDERTGRVHDHSARQDVLHKEILLPSSFGSEELGWARDRSILWNTAEAAERRTDARVAREYLVALPVELDPQQRVDLTRGFARELVDRYGFALDVAVHGPRDFPGSDARNFHAHLLATTREVTRDGLGAKTSVEMHELRRRRLGLKSGFTELIETRERWALVANAALEQARVTARIDHRSREARQEQQARSVPQEKLTVDEIRRRAREDWLRLRREVAAGRDIGSRDAETRNAENRNAEIQRQLRDEGLER